VAAHQTPERLEKRVEVGRPVDVICDLAEQLQADLIVVGAHGFASRAARVLVGSVSDRVVHTARRPVTVVH
jgi:nucleotide-binding universal stress UspA family protein